MVVEHFEENHTRDASGRYVVPLPMKKEMKPLGELRSMAIKRLLSLKQSLQSKEQFDKLANAMQEYFDMDHAELVPSNEISKPHAESYYLPMHVVWKEDSSTSKLQIVFHASAMHRCQPS